MTQQAKILEYMRTHRTITSMEAFSKLHCTRLAAQIFALKEKGHTITTYMEYGTNSYGEPSKWAIYSLDEDKANAN